MNAREPLSGADRPDGPAGRGGASPDGSPGREEDPYAHALRDGRGPLFLRRSDGGSVPSDVTRWCEEADAADMTVLHRCEGSVLDIGCGPGRLVAALKDLGHVVLGIDISLTAVERTADGGGAALRRSVFDLLPGEGRWRSALLMDGNIGIGGDPRALLRRVSSLVDPDGGLLLVEIASVDVEELLEVRFEDGRGHSGASFPWARVGASALRRTAKETDWLPTAAWSVGDRHFAELRRATGR